MIKRIGKEDFVINDWSGGQTTQLAIYPQDATLGNRDFVWRISSATFTTTHSSFSDFSGYNRYILPLEGELSLFHKGLYQRALKPYEVEFFSGSWQTDSQNSANCRDYNFVVQEGKAINLQVLKSGETYIPKRTGTLCIFSVENFSLEIIKEKKETIQALSWELLILQEEESLHLIQIAQAKAPVIVCEVEV